MRYQGLGAYWKQRSPHKPLPVLFVGPSKRPIEEQPQRRHIHHGIEGQLDDSSLESGHGQMEPKEQEGDGVVAELQQCLGDQRHAATDKEEEYPNNPPVQWREREEMEGGRERESYKLATSE